MEELTIEQQRAVAIAKARLRVGKTSQPATPSHNLNTPERRAAEAAAKTAQYPLHGVETRGKEPWTTRAAAGFGEGLQTLTEPLLHPLNAISDSFDRQAVDRQRMLRNEPLPPSPLSEQASKIAADPVEGLANTAGVLAPMLIPGLMRTSSSRLNSAMPIPDVMNAPISTLPSRALTATAETISPLLGPRGLASSIAQPTQESFRFGKDPLDAAMKVPGARTYEKYRANVRQKLNAYEAQLKQAIEERARSMRAVNKPNANGKDVEPGLRAAYKAKADDARLNGNDSAADAIEKAGERRIQSILNKYGTTYLEGDKILAEKRDLGKSTRFKTQEVHQANLNEAFADMYRSLDADLDALIPSSKSLNNNYSNMLELDKLLEERILKEGHGPVSKKFLSELANMSKTKLIQAMNYGKFEPNTMGGTTPTYESFPAPVPDVYSTRTASGTSKVPSGGQPLGEILSPSAPRPTDPYATASKGKSKVLPTPPSIPPLIDPLTGRVIQRYQP